MICFHNRQHVVLHPIFFSSKLFAWVKACRRCVHTVFIWCTFYTFFYLPEFSMHIIKSKALRFVSDVFAILADFIKHGLKLLEYLIGLNLLHFQSNTLYLFFNLFYTQVPRSMPFLVKLIYFGSLFVVLLPYCFYFLRQHTFIAAAIAFDNGVFWFFIDFFFFNCILLRDDNVISVKVRLQSIKVKVPFIYAFV